MIDTCIFDLDGTLIDSMSDLGITVNKMLEEDGRSPYPIAAYATFVGDGVDMLLQRAFQVEDKLIVKGLRKRFDMLYPSLCLENTIPYPGIKRVLENLKKKNIKLAIVTNKPHDIATIMVNKIFPDTFLCVYGNADAYPKKPDPTKVLEVVEELHTVVDSCIYIGDSDVDIQTGQNAKMKTIGVAWGFRGRAELENAGANKVVEEAREIEELVYDWC